MSSRRRLAAVFVPAILAGLIVSPSSATGSDMAADALTDSERKALTFRQMFGLESDIAVIRSAEHDPAYSSTDYGVPLSGAEQAELQRRVQLEWDTRTAAAFGRRQPTWAGHWFNQHSRGAPVFLFTDDIDTMRMELQRRLPQGAEYRVEQVDRSLVQLTGTQEAIVAAYPEIRASGIHVTSTGIDLVGNTVKVGIFGMTDDAIESLQRQFGAHLTFKEQPPAVADACPNSNCRPIKGGIKMDGVTGRDCTSGFVVRRVLNGARLSILTAGHCIWVQDPATGGLNKRWYHETSSGANDYFGDSKYHTYTSLSNGDVGLIELDDNEAPSTANKMYINNGSSGAIYTITGYVFDDDQTVGSQACAYGFASNNSDCVTITDFDETMESCATPVGGSEVCRDIRHTKLYGYNLIGGDSGGPIYQVVSGSNRRALGTHVHSVAGGPNNGTGWYTPYNWGRTAYVLASPGDNYSICTTASC